MIELIKFVVGTFSEHHENVVYDVKEDGRTVTVVVTLDPGDMGKVIGKQGRIAKALRTVVKAAATRENKKVNVEII